MVTVIFLFQLFYCLFLCHAVHFAKFLYLILEHRKQFFFGDAAKCVETGVVADVCRLVETAEHADLRELGDSREQHKLQMLVRELENAIKAFKYLAVIVFKSLYVSSHNR